MVDIALRGELWDNDSADVLRWLGWRDITAPMDIAAALEAADGDDVTVLINSRGGDMTVGGEIRSMFRRYKGNTTALYQGYGASAATIAASGCKNIQSEPGALLCYHNPSCTAHGDFRFLQRSAEGMRNARDCILEVYTARSSVKTREDLMSLMDKDIWITPTQAKEYGLIDSIVGCGDEIVDPAAFVAATGSRIRLTESMVERYQTHMAESRADALKQEQAKRVLARAKALAQF